MVSKVIGLEISSREEIEKALVNLGDHWEKVSGEICTFLDINYVILYLELCSVQFLLS